MRRGDPVAQVVAVALGASAPSVHVAPDFGPRGRRRDADVASALASHSIKLVRPGSPYAVAPGRVRTRTGDPYQVFGRYSRAWGDHGWARPPRWPRAVRWVRPLQSHDLGDTPDVGDLSLPAAGELAARRRWHNLLQRRLDDYPANRDRADL